MCILGSFLKAKILYGNNFGGLLNFHTHLGLCPTLLIFFGINCRCWVKAYISRKMKVPPPVGDTPPCFELLFCISRNKNKIKFIEFSQKVGLLRSQVR